MSPLLTEMTAPHPHADSTGWAQCRWYEPIYYELHTHGRPEVTYAEYVELVLA